MFWIFGLPLAKEVGLHVPSTFLIFCTRKKESHPCLSRRRLVWIGTVKLFFPVKKKRTLHCYSQMGLENGDIASKVEYTGGIWELQVEWSWSPVCVHILVNAQLALAPCPFSKRREK